MGSGPGAFDAGTDDLGEPAEEVSTRCGELVATDESTVISKPFHDPIVVEDRQGNGRFPNPPWTDESDRSRVFCETNNLLDKLVAPEKVPGRWGRRFSKRGATER